MALQAGKAAGKAALRQTGRISISVRVAVRGPSFPSPRLSPPGERETRIPILGQSEGRGEAAADGRFSLSLGGGRGEGKGRGPSLGCSKNWRHPAKPKKRNDFLRFDLRCGYSGGIHCLM